LLTAYCLLEFIFIVIIIEFLFHGIQLDGIESDDLEGDSTLVTIHQFAFVCVDINMNIGIAFGTGSSRHFSYLQ